jgi:hypothetical protein
MPVASISPGTMRKPPPIPKKPESPPVASPQREQFRHVPAVELHALVADGRATGQHQAGDDEHQYREEHQQFLAVDRLAQARSGERAEHAGRGEHEGAAPFHRSPARVLHNVRGGTDGDGERTRADRHVRARHTHQVDQQRHRQDRSAAADKAEREADNTTGYDAERVLDEPARHRGPALT